MISGRLFLNNDIFIMISTLWPLDQLALQCFTWGHLEYLTPYVQFFKHRLTILMVAISPPAAQHVTNQIRSIHHIDSIPSVEWLKQRTEILSSVCALNEPITKSNLLANTICTTTTPCQSINQKRWRILTMTCSPVPSRSPRLLTASVLPQVPTFVSYLFISLFSNHPVYPIRYQCSIHYFPNHEPKHT